MIEKPTGINQESIDYYIVLGNKAYNENKLAQARMYYNSARKILSELILKEQEIKDQAKNLRKYMKDIK